MKRNLIEALEKVGSWPSDAQDALAEIARDIDDSIHSGEYEPTLAERAGIDRGIADAEAGRFATEAEIENVLSKLRGA